MPVMKAMAPLALAATLIVPALASAADNPPRRIVVIGEGEAAAKPDMAVLTLTVMREAATAREALDANNQAMSDVISAMKSSGVEERDLQTAGVQINPRYDYANKPDGTQEARLVAYQVSNTLTIRVRDLAKTGQILDLSVTLGVNEGGNVVLTNADPSAFLDEARRDAVADAIAKARTLSAAAGVELGQILEISDVSYAQPPIPLRAKAFAATADRVVPIEAGENAYKVQINVTFELR